LHDRGGLRGAEVGASALVFARDLPLLEVGRARLAARAQAVGEALLELRVQVRVTLKGQRRLAQRGFAGLRVGVGGGLRGEQRFPAC